MRVAVRRAGPIPARFVPYEHEVWAIGHHLPPEAGSGLVILLHFVCARLEDCSLDDSLVSHNVKLILKDSFLLTLCSRVMISVYARSRYHSLHAMGVPVNKRVSALICRTLHDISPRTFIPRNLSLHIRLYEEAGILSSPCVSLSLVVV